ncbi:hypothetical protein KUA08_12140, partial [Komagataeibacter melomenusus]|nr:hypothetical protein [Komagataeibacter melomenusus]
LLLQAQGVQAYRHAERQDRQIIRSDDLSLRCNHQFTIIPNRPQKASKNATFLKKGSTQKLLSFFINDLFSNSFLKKHCQKIFRETDFSPRHAA